MMKTLQEADCMVEKKDIFGKEYFDSGKRETGRFANYSYNRMFASYEKLASILIDVVSPRRVLDIGCAKGFLVHAFWKAGVECYGVDVSEYAISQAHKEIRQYLKVHDVDNTDLPFVDNSFDLITAVGVLDYVHDRFRAMREIRRVLKNRATLFLSVAYVSNNDKYRTTLQGRQQWIRELAQEGFEFQQTITDDKYLLLMDNFLQSATSAKAFLSKSFLRLPFCKNIMKPYLESRWGILFFKLTK